MEAGNQDHLNQIYEEKKAQDLRAAFISRMYAQQAHFGQKISHRVRRGDDGNLYMRTCTAAEMKNFRENNLQTIDPFLDPAFGRKWDFFPCRNIPEHADVHYVHLIVGKQNVGKSTLCSALLSPVTTAFHVANDSNLGGKVKDYLHPNDPAWENQFSYRYPYRNTVNGFTLKPSSVTSDKVFHYANRDGKIEKHYLVDTPGLLDTTDIAALHALCRHQDGPLNHLGFWPMNNGKRSSCDLAYSHSLKREFSDHNIANGCTVIKSVTLCLGSIIDTNVQNCQPLIESFVRNFETTILDQGKVSVILNREGMTAGSYWIQNMNTAAINKCEELLLSPGLPKEEADKLRMKIAHFRQFPLLALDREQFNAWYLRLREFESLIRACLLRFASSEERGRAMSAYPIEFSAIDCNPHSVREMACFLTNRQAFLSSLLQLENRGVNPNDLLVKKPHAQMREHHQLMCEMLGLPPLPEKPTHRNCDYFRSFAVKWAECLRKYGEKCNEFQATLKSLSPLEQTMNLAAVKIAHFQLQTLSAFRGSVLVSALLPSSSSC
jgi:hypothetical protein